jgi:hypothetical protein
MSYICSISDITSLILHKMHHRSRTIVLRYNGDEATQIDDTPLRVLCRRQNRNSNIAKMHSEHDSRSLRTSIIQHCIHSLPRFDFPWWFQLSIAKRNSDEMVVLPPTLAYSFAPSSGFPTPCSQKIFRSSIISSSAIHNRRSLRLFSVLCND